MKSILPFMSEFNELLVSGLWTDQRDNPKDGRKDVFVSITYPLWLSFDK